MLNEHAQGGLGKIPFTHAYPEIWVMEEADRARAREVLAQFEARATPSDKALCQACGGTNPATFEICWRCGKPLR